MAIRLILISFYLYFISPLAFAQCGESALNPISIEVSTKPQHIILMIEGNSGFSADAVLHFRNYEKNPEAPEAKAEYDQALLLSSKHKESPAFLLAEFLKELPQGPLADTQLFFFAHTQMEEAESCLKFMSQFRFKEARHSLSIIGFSNGAHATCLIAHDLESTVNIDQVITFDPIAKPFWPHPVFEKTTNVGHWRNYYQRNGLDAFETGVHVPLLKGRQVQGAENIQQQKDYHNTIVYSVGLHL